MAFRKLGPLIPKVFRNRLVELPVKPLRLTSTGKMYVFQPASRQEEASSAYFSLFLSNATSIPSSQGMVSSPIMTHLAELDQSTISGRSDDMIMCSGNLSWRPTSVLSCHSSAGENKDRSCTELLRASPAFLMNGIGWCSGVTWLDLFTCSLRTSITSAIFFSTRLCRHP